MAFIQDLLSGNNYPDSGEVEFKSSDHIRFQNGMNVSGHNYGCHRTVKIEKNISGGKGYTVTIFNDDGQHPMWGNNVQMSPKPMEVVRVSSSEIFLRGYGYDQNAVMMGIPMEAASFSSYALSLQIKDGLIDSCTLYMLDRNIELMYLR